MKFDKKWIQPGIAAVSLLCLLFPFVTVGVEDYYSDSLNGITVAFNTYIGILMIALPLALAAAPFSAKYQAKLPLLSVATPVVCVVAWLLCVLFAKTFVMDSADYSNLAFGAYATLICYLALGVYGFVTYKAELKALIDQLKNKGDQQ